MHPQQSLFVYVTIGSATEAEALARTLVQERLLACANIIPAIHSIYWWQGKMEESNEAVLVGKTTQARYPALEARVRQLHPYETPCIAALPITAGFAPFLQWVAHETQLHQE